MEDLIVVIVAPPFVCPRVTGTAGGFRRFGGGAGAERLCGGALAVASVFTVPGGATAFADIVERTDWDDMTEAGDRGGEAVVVVEDSGKADGC